MRRLIASSIATLFLAAPGAAPAATVLDPVGDFVPGFVGPANPDLDVTSFSVAFDGTNFLLGATLAGAINPATPGIYVIGVNTGAGAIRPFASIGQANVIFDQALVIRKDGTGSLGATTISPFAITLVGNILTARIPVSVLPSTGFGPFRYGFNLWPRVALGNNNQISDFAPNNALLAVVPEPLTWSLMVRPRTVGHRRPREAPQNRSPHCLICMGASANAEAPFSSIEAPAQRRTAGRVDAISVRAG